jgi:ABC-type polysaccharide/polyol phosphate transport system ATPase subunit
VIQVEALSKAYRIYRKPVDRLKEVLPFLKPHYESFDALKDISFKVSAGETVGIIGQNGAGKSTLLQILSGVLEPSGGTYSLNGRVGSLLELGAGFHPDFDGVQNVRLQGRLLGLPRDFIEERIPKILAFAEIGDFVRQPVRTYSSGMFVRLAFSSAVHMDPEVLIIDEALSVGDVFFQHKCIARMKQFQEEGKTILVVSHDPQTIRHLCDRAIHLRDGELVGDGSPEKIVAQYLQEKTRTSARIGSNAGEVHVEAVEGESQAPKERVLPLPPPLKDNLERFGEGGAQIFGAGIYDPKGNLLDMVEGGKNYRLQLMVQASRDVAPLNVGFILRDKKGLDLFGTNLAVLDKNISNLEEGNVVVVSFLFDLPKIASGNYSFACAVAEGDAVDYTMLDWVDHALVIQCRTEGLIIGHLQIPMETHCRLLDPSTTQ